MSTKDIVCTHKLVIKFDQLEDGSVNWHVKPSAAITNTSHASFEELVEAGAPLSALGIRALRELLSDNLITFALDRANGFLWKDAYKCLDQQEAPDSLTVEGELVSDVEESRVVH